VSGWLDPLRAALDEAAAPVSFFFRDDDAGWADERLHRLLDVFEAAEAPIGLAAIPCAVTPLLARALAGRQGVRAHQHGFAHADHERVGRKCEFGPSRTGHLQRADIVDGRRRLLDLLDGELDPIFTPPWNRCTVATGRALVDVGLRALSRDATAEPLGVDGLDELPVAVDWVRERHRGSLGATLALAARRAEPVGVMLHHAVMDEEDRHDVARLFALLAESPSVRLAPMAELVQSAGQPVT
jgi:hypothetical protein